MRRALLFGSDGQLGTELRRRRWPADFAVVVAPQADFDFSKPELLEERLLSAKPDALVNAAAFTAVDRAETERDLAERVNALSPGVLARVAQRLSIPLLHVSTDYVFDGSLEREYVEADAVGPINVYGATKEHGERLVRSGAEKHAILRTSWVYSAHGANFVKTMMRLGAERAELRVVDDQVGRPTHAGGLADALLGVLASFADGSRAYGTYHCAGDEAMSWAAFARNVMRLANLNTTVTSISTAEYPTPAQRPQNSRLDCTLLQTTFGIRAHSVEESLRECVRELKGERS